MATLGQGTATVTSGSQLVTFVGANLVTLGLQSGAKIIFGSENVRYTVGSVTGENAVTLVEPYVGTNQSGLSYFLSRFFTATQGFAYLSAGDLNAHVPLNANWDILDAFIAAGGGGGGATTLGALTDVNLAGITDGQAIVYNASTQTFNPATISGGGGGASDHGALTGLGDDDHTQYFNQTRGDARYVQISNLNLATSVASGLMSASDFTKLSNIAAGAEVNVQSDWNAASGDAFIQNKPTIPDQTSDLTNDSLVASVVGGTNVTIDNTDPRNPVINASGGGGGGGDPLAIEEEGTQVIASALRLNFIGEYITAANTGVGSEVSVTVGVPTVTTSVRGLMSAADKTKLDGIEAGATADQSAIEIKTAYESNTNTNAFTDAFSTKLTGIEDNATADQTDAEIKTAYENNANTNAFTDAEQTKLTGIEDNATADQTGAEIKLAYENEADTNAYTDDEKSKLFNIEAAATADQTDAEIKEAYENNANTNAYTDAEKAKLASIDANHYLAPVADLVALAAISQGTLTDKARIFVESEREDYFYDAELTSANADASDVAPNDQASSTGYWRQIDITGETAASIKTKYESNPDTNAFTDADHTKLDGIETGATADQTDAEIKTAYENNANTNAFTDAEQTKLTGIETGAEVNVQSDWDATTGDALILNKPTIPETLDALTDVTASAPQDGQALVFFTAFNEWRPSTISGGGGGGSGTASEIDISENTFNISANDGLDGQADTERSIDRFAASTNIDAATSSNEDYDAGGDYYSADVDTASSTDLVPVMTSNTAPSGEASADQNNANAFRAFDATGTEYVLSNSVGNTGTNRWIQYEFVSAQTVTAISLQNGVGTLNGPSTVTIEGSNDGVAFTDIATVNYGSWGAFNNQYRLAFFENDTAYTHYRMFLGFALSGTQVEIADLQLIGAGGTTRLPMTLQSNAFTAAEQPDQIFVCVWHEDLETDATLNTDLIAAVSRDNGTTFTNAVLTDFQRIGQYRVSTAVVDVSAQPAGTQIKYRVNTVAGPEVRIHGMALDWAIASGEQLTGAEIKALYESEADTNAFTDADVTKLTGIEANATADQTGAEIKTAYEGEADTNAFTDADHTKLDGIEANATADQTGAEIKTAYEGEADTNAFTDADHTKLDGIAAGAEVNVQSDWNEADTGADSHILNKPTIPANTSDLNNDSVVTSVVAGTNVTIDNTDPRNPIVNATGGGGGAVAVRDEGTQVVATASAINFVGAGVTATDGGSGVATVTIPGGGGTTPPSTALSSQAAVRNWSTIPIPSQLWRSVTYSPELGLFCAVGASGSGNRVVTSPDGVFWTNRTTPVDNDWKSVVWGAGASLFVAVSNSGTGNRVMTSPDGINWTIRTSPVDNNWRTVTWSESLGLFCAVSLDGAGDKVMTSPDGINWTTRVNSSSSFFLGVTWASGLNLFIAVGFSGTELVMTSPDGINWTSRTPATTTDTYESVAYSPELGLVVAVASGGAGGRIMTSPDGINWTARTAPADLVWASVIWASGIGMFIAVAVSGTGNRIMTSTDGINWNLRQSAQDSGWLALAWSEDRMLAVAVADSGTDRGMRTL